MNKFLRPGNFLSTITMLLIMSFTVHSQEALTLYPGEVPNSRAVPDQEWVEDRGAGGRAFYATSVPEITPFLPPHPNGKAVVICPGGGYVKTAFDKEGVWVAEALNRDSITAFVLKYRIPQDTANVDKSLAPLQDAQQALRFVRDRAEEYGIRPDRIGIMGFSAGGHLAATAATQFSRLADANERSTTSVRPDFLALLYPVISFTPELMHAGSRKNLLGETPTAAEDLRFSAEKSVSDATPPAFLVHAADDKSVPVGNSLAFYEACLAHGVPVEMHLYPGGGHGFGLVNKTTPDRWLERLVNWLRTL